jgi:hypothetical protein
VDNRAILDAAMSEADFQKTVIDLAKMNGWLVHHQLVPFRLRRGRPTAIVEEGVDPGFPDLVLVHPVRKMTLFVELKREKGKVSEDQKIWGSALREMCDYRLWYPHDWEEIERTLKKEERP